MSVFVLVPYCFDYCSFIVYSDIKTCDSSSSIFLSHIVWLLVSFVFPYKLSICSSPVKNVIGILIGTALYLYTALGSMAMLTILVLPIQEHSISFHLFLSSVFYNFLSMDLLPL